MCVYFYGHYLHCGRLSVLARLIHMRSGGRVNVIINNLPCVIRALQLWPPRSTTPSPPTPAPLHPLSYSGTVIGPPPPPHPTGPLPPPSFLSRLGSVFDFVWFYFLIRFVSFCLSIEFRLRSAGMIGAMIRVERFVTFCRSMSSFSPTKFTFSARNGMIDLFFSTVILFGTGCNRIGLSSSFPLHFLLFSENSIVEDPTSRSPSARSLFLFLPCFVFAFIL